MEPGDLADKMTPEELDKLIDSWVDASRPLSRHLELAVAAAAHRTRRNLPALKDAEPVPGCGCPYCTGIAADAPVRTAPLKAGHLDATYRPRLNVEAARAVPLLDVVRRLGLNPIRQGRAWVVRCPLHEDHRPSLRLDPAKGLWFCHPCGEGGDGIRLIQRARGLNFVDTVKELLA